MAEYDVINGFLGNIGFGFKDVVDKVKDTASKVTEGAKQISPQYQAAQAAMSQFKTVQTTTPSGRTISRRVPVTSSTTAIPTTRSKYKTGTGLGAKLNAMSRKIFGRQSIFGIPTIIAAPTAILGGFSIYKMLRRRKA